MYITGKKAIIFGLLVILCCTVQAQRSANWFFGDHAGIKFTKSGVTNLLTSSINTQEGCASISDTAGNLLFYTDGSTVYNSSHQTMVNGTGLSGNTSSSQSSIIVPMPGSDSLFYIFTATVPTLTARYYYNVVDMSLQGGLGEVVQKNILLSADMCSERITAITHDNKRDFWILTNPVGTNIFKAFLLTDAGLQTTPVVSQVGVSPQSGYGMVKGSPDGTMLVQTASSSSPNPSPFIPFTQLFHFDAANGTVSDPIGLYYPQSTYGCSFSPDSKRLYVTSGFPNPSIGGPFGQFTVDNYDSTIIRNSFYSFNVNTPGGWGDISLGPDSVLYIVRCVEKKLSAIKNPNDYGPSCIFADAAVSLTGRGIFGLPNFYNNINLPAIYLNIKRIGCLQYRFSFNTNYQGTGTYTWNFGDGITSNDSAAVHTFVRNSNDSFLVKFHFVSADGSVNINLQQWLKLPKKPKATFTAQTNGCIGNNISLVNTSTSNGGAQYHWNFGDNTTSTDPVPVKRYTDSGTYIIRLSLSDTLGCLSDTVTATVAINKKAIAGLVLNAPYCANTNIAVSDTSHAWNSTITEWRYNLGNGYSGRMSPLSAATFNVPGNYILKLVAVSAEGCISDTATKQLAIYERPKAGFSMPQNCVTDLSSFTDTSVVTSSAITNWQWTFDDPFSGANTSTAQHPSHQYAQARNYNVQLAVTTNYGCTDTIVQVFTVNGALPKAYLTFEVNPVCSGNAIGLMNNSSVNFGKLTALQVDWGNTITSDVNPVSGKIYRHNYTAFGTPATMVQAVRLTVQSGISCINTLDTLITLKAHPAVQFQSIAPVCANGDAIVLSQGSEIRGAAGSGDYFGTGVSKDDNGAYWFTPLNVTTSTASVGYRYTTTGGCSDTAKQDIIILPKPEVNAGASQVIGAGKQVKLNGSATGNGLSLIWSPATWLSDVNTLTPVSTPLNDITYILTATTAEGCSDTSSVQVRVLQPIKVPNAFSPNGDGINDTWDIANLASYSKPGVQVFDRWGRLVFQSTGYKKPWNGTNKGKELLAGTYYYIITPGNDAAIVTGWVQLLR